MFLSSVSAERGGGVFGGVAYSAAKAAQLGFARALARELGPHGVTVNSVAPGLIDTDITGGALEGARKSQLIAGIPVGRNGNVADVADLITYLCRERPATSPEQPTTSTAARTSTDRHRRLTRPGPTAPVPHRGCRSRPLARCPWDGLLRVESISHRWNPDPFPCLIQLISADKAANVAQRSAARSTLDLRVGWPGTLRAGPRPVERVTGIEPALSAGETEMVIDLQGNPDEAGFVQVIRGRASDPARVRELMTRDSEEWASLRPDILGSVSVSSGDAYTAVIYCTEAEAVDEKKEMPREEGPDRAIAVGAFDRVAGQPMQDQRSYGAFAAAGLEDPEHRDGQGAWWLACCPCREGAARGAPAASRGSPRSAHLRLRRRLLRW